MSKPATRAARNSWGCWAPSILRRHRFLWWTWEEWTIGTIVETTKEEALQAARRWEANEAADGELYYEEQKP